VTISPSALTLTPGEEEQVEFTFHTPRSYLSRAGRHSITVQAYNLRNAQQINEIRTILTVAPYTAFTATLWPQELTPGQETQLTLENQGNTVETFTIQPKSEKKLRIEPGRAQLKVAPGDSGTADFQIFPRRQYWIGGTQVDTFSLTATAADGQTAVQTGQLTSQGTISPQWALVALLSVILLGCAAAAFYPLLFVPEANATAAFEATVQAATATTEAGIASGAQDQQATAEAAAATATWLGQDDDRDGLLNGDELNTYNTLANNPDTDGDGLSDSKEVMEFGTNPLEADTDSDGLLDGYEIERGWDPLNRDSDGDGIPDGIDIHPGQQPTLTPEVPVTPSQGVIGIQFSGEPVFLQLLLFGNEPRYQANEVWGSISIEVELTRPSDQRISVNYRTLDGSARAFEDYMPIDNGVLVFEPGETTQRFAVQMINDSSYEVDENFYVTLSDPTPIQDIQINTPQAEIVVISDDE
jgi:hypothetical protein